MIALKILICPLLIKYQSQPHPRYSINTFSLSFSDNIFLHKQNMPLHFKQRITTILHFKIFTIPIKNYLPSD